MKITLLNRLCGLLMLVFASIGLADDAAENTFTTALKQLTSATLQERQAAVVQSAAMPEAKTNSVSQALLDGQLYKLRRRHHRYRTRN